MKWRCSPGSKNSFRWFVNQHFHTSDAIAHDLLPPWLRILRSDAQRQCSGASASNNCSGAADAYRSCDCHLQRSLGGVRGWRTPQLPQKSHRPDAHTERREVRESKDPLHRHRPALGGDPEDVRQENQAEGSASGDNVCSHFSASAVICSAPPASITERRRKRAFQSPNGGQTDQRRGQQASRSLRPRARSPSRPPRRPHQRPLADPRP